jgi:formylmethanofuran dehydrogenase subunit E
MNTEVSTYIGRPCKYGHTGLRYLKSGVCIECAKVRNSTPERQQYYRSYNAKYKHTAEFKESQRKYLASQKRKECMFAANLARKYNITPEIYFKMLETQNYRCKICNELFENWELVRGRNSGICIDHCHTTNVIRGILCRNCNFAIGNLSDNPNHAANASMYLQTAGSI